MMHICLMGGLAHSAAVGEGGIRPTAGRVILLYHDNQNVKITSYTTIPNATKDKDHNHKTKI